MPDCTLCSPILSPVLVESEYWRCVLNRNQNLLGKCMLALRRHLEAVPQLSQEEWLDLQAQIRRVHAALCAAFQPDHFNYAFLQNQDRHVHLHVIPRYASPRDFAGIEFTDPDYPGHYTALNAPRRLPGEGAFAELADDLRKRLTLPAA